MSKSLLIVDHGSMVQAANDMLEEVAEVIRSLKPGLIVEIAHMELAEPSIEDGFKACVARGATEVIVHPYMLSPGRHATKDIPRMVEKIASEMPDISYRVSDPLGIDEHIGLVVLKRTGLDN